MKNGIKNMCAQCSGCNSCKETRCPLWSYRNSGNPNPEREKLSGDFPSRARCIATVCFYCKGNTKEGIENCNNESCPLWRKRKYSRKAVLDTWELWDSRRCLGLEPVDEYSPLIRLIYMLNGVEMYDDNESEDTNSRSEKSSKPIHKRRRKISDELRAIIKTSHASVRTLAKRYKCSPTTIQKIRKGG